MKRTCKQCGKDFELSGSEIKFFKSKGLNLPKRCKECRAANRQNRTVQLPKKSNNAGLISFAVTFLAVLAIVVVSFVKPLLDGSRDMGYEISNTFRDKENLTEHFEKHGKQMGFRDENTYLAAANEVINDPDSLHKQEKEDGDDVYYRESTNEIVIVSGDGYIRTYFEPEDGMDYFNRQ